METTTNNQVEVMTPKMVAQFLHKSERTITYWFSTKKLIAKRIGGSWLILKDDLVKQLSRGA
jgi:hypothetical protein